MTKQSLGGAVYLAQGFKLLKHPRVRLFVVAPLLINVLLFVGITAWAIGAFNELLDWLLSYIPGWLDFIVWLIWPLFIVLLLLIYGYSFALISNLIASPFYGLLAERVSEVLTNRLDETPMTLKRATRIAWSSFKRELRKLGYFLPRMLGVGLLVLALTFIPVLNVLTPVIAFLWGAWSLALQYLDYPADNHEVAFDGMLNRLKERRSMSVGFGGIVLVATSVPVLNLFTSPAAVAGATKMWEEKLHATSSKPRVV